MPVFVGFIKHVKVVKRGFLSDTNWNSIIIQQIKLALLKQYNERLKLYREFLAAGIKPQSKEPKIKETFHAKVELSIRDNSVIDRALGFTHGLCRFEVKDGVITQIDLVDSD